MPIPYLTCMIAAAQFYQLPPRVLPALQAVEAGRPGIVSMNTNGTQDLGVMQINTIWIAPLSAFARMPRLAVRERLISDPCFNIAAAGAIMRLYLTEARGDVVTAVGYYHSHRAAHAEPYRAKVLRMATILFERIKPAAAPPGRQEANRR